ncbi:hypothetical protein QR680_002298 [Steinernema hermaphroditum]|uniref:Galectin n=1 Tax=Steinernema hermaphroditum TaxID=289476 RepID=A0AA39H326_9BILA|nr:hypothetical protein QR680_002298 [Steinernema hermaphroditum]
MHLIENPAVPFSTPIISGVNHDAKIEIHGTPYCGSHESFVIELLTREGIALHLNARFGYMGEHILVINSMECGRWQREERHHLPFHHGHHFHLKIKNHGSHFSIHANGHHVCHFHHRISPHHITALGIRGDVRISKVHFEHFHHHNGGGVAFGTGGTGYGYAPAPAPVVVIEEGHHHHGHHHHHGFFGHHHHHHHC